MAYQYRRLVTGHDSAGKAVVVHDDVFSTAELRPGGHASVAWATAGFPIDINDPRDGSELTVRTSEPDGTVFRIVRYDPDVTPRRHRTNSIDYAVVLSGSIEIELDSETVRLCAGDVLIQRGTVHNWINRGKDPCTIAFVLIGANPPIVNGQSLAEHG
jgi:quercetin dioxygenase-like cupin family protein